MNNSAKIVPLPTNHPSFFQATIREVREDKQKATIISQHSFTAKQWYQIPLNLQNNIAPGDTVLCTGDECFFILNLVAKKENQKIQTFSPDQELLFEYDPATNKSRVFIDKGDLEFISTDGDIAFNAARNLVLNGNNVDLSGNSRVSIGVKNDTGKQTASLSIDPRQVDINSVKLAINSKQAQVCIDEMRYTGRKYFGTISTVQLVSRKLECVAKTISQKAENIFQKVKSLSQLRAGRKHEIIDTTYHLKADQAILKSDHDFKVKAEKIHLG